MGWFNPTRDGAPRGRLLTAAGWLATLGLLAVTAAGFLAFEIQRFEALDHLRQLYLLGGVLLLAGLVVGRRLLPAAVVLVTCLVNGALVLPELPRPGIEAHAHVRAHGQGDAAPRDLTLLTYNILVRNRQHDALLDWLRASDADIIVLQEVGWQFAGRLTELADVFPHRAHCAYGRRCDLAILSRRPWRSVAFQGRRWNPSHPPLLVARFGEAGDGGFTLVGLHFQNPVRPYNQQREYTDTAALLAGLKGPLVVTGDFNAAPWSVLLRRLRERTGLYRQARTWGTWPVLAGPLGVPIDHVLSTPDIDVRSAVALQGAGSDHRPVRVTLSLPE